MSAVKGLGGVSVTSFPARYMICSSGLQSCFLLFIWCVYLYGQVHTIVHVWRSEDSLGKGSSLSTVWLPQADLMQAWQQVPLLTDHLLASFLLLCVFALIVLWHRISWCWLQTPALASKCWVTDVNYYSWLSSFLHFICLCVRYFVCTHVYVCLGPEEAGRDQRIPWSWRYSCGSSAWAASAVNLWALPGALHKVSLTHLVTLEDNCFYLKECRQILVSININVISFQWSSDSQALKMRNKW